MKRHFRKTEYYTSHNANEPVELDSEKFPDFKGETEEDFLQYIFDNLDEWTNGDDDSIFDEETMNQLFELNSGSMVEYWGSYQNYFEGDLQVGEITPESNHKNGNFEVKHSISIG
jgi:hypothetical protein